VGRDGGKKLGTGNGEREGEKKREGEKVSVRKPR